MPKVFTLASDTRTANVATIAVNTTRNHWRNAGAHAETTSGSSTMAPRKRAIQRSVASSSERDVVSTEGAVRMYSANGVTTTAAAASASASGTTVRGQRAAVYSA